jgi:hypothetical protein
MLNRMCCDGCLGKTRLCNFTVFYVLLHPAFTHAAALSFAAL